MQTMATGGEQPGTLIMSVGRAINVLDCLGSSNRPLSAKHIARATSLSLGTTYNVLRTLMHSRYVVAERDGYVLGPAHPALAAERGAVDLARGRAVLNGIRDELRAAIYLGKFSDGEIEIVDIVDSPLTPRVDLWVGLQDGAHATAFGKQILASVDRATRMDYITRHPLAELTPYTISSPREFLCELEQGNPVMVDEQEYSLGFTCLAVPVIASHWVGSLAVSFPAEREQSGTRRKDQVRTLHEAAGKLSLMLGLD